MKKRYIAIIGILLLYFLAKMKLSNSISEQEAVNANQISLNLDKKDFNVLVYSQANEWVHEDAIPAAKEMITLLSEQNDWNLTISDEASIYNPKQLALFDVVIWNNVTGNTLNTNQRLAFKNYLENGGGFVGFHGSGDSSGSWDWYYDEVIRARFSHHPMVPQFQVGTLNKECPENFPTCKELPIRWDQEEEWYVFYESPRKKGAHILYTLDETNTVMSGVLEDGTPEDKAFGMPEDHPVVWYNCVGKGKAFYSALGHKGYYYKSPNYHQLFTEAINWAGNPKIKCN